ncbi:TadE/TadG family type IV pilus assembly protein [Stappia indica]|uniref:TadE/TadG family type IV pilus assembly protein n=1 Tax=Stappia indica TaxID=538381 RepID=UPI001CD81093|nr:VWA domain-containing protein [Stappia indica]MCA1297728.1 VWA domain-containing protein [Stappia indica]
MRKFRHLLSKFADDRSGALVIMLALAAAFLIMIVGAGLDFARGHNTKSRLQAAVDAAALAANYDSDGLSEDAIKENATRYFNSTYVSRQGTKAEVEVTVVKGVVTVVAREKVPALFGSFFGNDTLDVSAHSQTVVGKATFDVVMVLDNSGSMGGSKLTTLKKAGKDLAETLFEINKTGDKHDRVKIGLVPFTSFVNIGKESTSEDWMDREGRSPIHWTNFETRADGTPDPNEFDQRYFVNGRPSRFTLFKQLKHTDWLGCVEARPMPYDVTDAAPTKSDPATLFVPQFAPAEPLREKNQGDYKGKFTNFYLDEDKGACTTSVKRAYKNSGMTRPEYAQKRLCKYRNQPRSYGNSYTKGPNYNCRTVPVTDLTDNETTIYTGLRNMKATGNTNIQQGTVWGWRMLTPGAPFTSGREKDETSDNEHVRILIVMTDGQNTYTNQYTFNQTRPEAYGYGAEQRLGRGVDRSWEIQQKMDERTALTCENAKADGVSIYTVAFQISDRDTVKMMRNCATSPNMAFEAKSNNDLVEAFERIADEISKLRLAR